MNDPQTFDLETALAEVLPAGEADSSTYSKSSEGEPSFSSTYSKIPVGQVVPGSVYPALSAHQQAEKNWRYFPVALIVHEWWDRFNDKCGLRIPKIGVRLEYNIRRNCLGYYRNEHNELGIPEEIAFGILPHLTNQKAFEQLIKARMKAVQQAVQSDIDQDELAKINAAMLACVNQGELLGTLLHEQLHLHQRLYGKPGKKNYHNEQFQKLADGLGLIVTDEGIQGYHKDGTFQDLLKKNGIVPPPPLPDGQAPMKKVVVQGKSKQKLWVCKCSPPFKPRQGRADFRAICYYCKEEFVLVGNPGTNPSAGG